MISACMTVSVRELRTAVRKWACCIQLRTSVSSCTLQGLYTGLDKQFLIFSYPSDLTCFRCSKEPSHGDLLLQLSKTH